MAENLPWYGTAFNVSVSLYTPTGLITNPGTITCKISKDYGDYGDVAGSVTVEDSTYGQIKVALNATDMTAYHIDGYVIDDTADCIAAVFHIDTIPVVRGLAGTALPNAAADAAGGLPISDAGGLDLDAQIGTDIDAILEDTGTTLDNLVDDLETNLATTDGKVDQIVAAVITNAAGTDIAADIIALKAVADDILTDTGTTLNDLVDGLESELAKVPKSDSNVTWNATALASINAEVDAALAAYDPPTKAEMDSAIGDVPTAAETVAELMATDYTSEDTADTFGKWLMAVRTLLGHKSVENSAHTSVSFKDADDSTEAGTMSWSESTRTRGRYTDW